MLRKIVILAFIGGGVWLALRGVDELARRTDYGAHLNLWTGEGILLAIPVVMIGGLFGGFVGGLLLPLKK